MTSTQIPTAKNKQICHIELVEDEQICLPTIVYFDKLNMTIDGAFVCDGKNFIV